MVITTLVEIFSIPECAAVPELAAGIFKP